MGDLALFAAVKKKSLQEVEALLKAGASTNARDICDDTPLLIAAEYCEYDIVNILIQYGANVHAKNEFNQTPLHTAMQSQHLDVVSLLLDKGSIIDAVDNDGMTPLLIAAFEGNDKFVELFLQKGADVHFMGTRNNEDIGTALHFAAQSYGFHAKETIETLLKAGADIEAVDSDGWTPLHTASSKPEIYMAENVRVLLEHGAEIDKICPKSSSHAHGTALHLALYYRRSEIVDVLLKSGANVHIRNDSGMTPLLVAVSVGNNKFVDDLIHLGADVNSADNEMKTALHIAAACKFPSEAVALLLDKGASIDLLDSKGRTPLHYACAEGHEDTVAILLEIGAKMDIVSDETTDEIGGTALHWAVGKNRPEIVEILLKAGASVDIKNKDGSTPLHDAASLGYSEIADRLIEFGANVNERDQLGRAPLHLSATKGFDEVVLMLIGNGADLEIKSGDWVLEDDDGETEYTGEPLAGTALLFAVEFDHINTVEVLLKAGANIDAGDVDGATAIHHAAWNNNCKMINALLLYGANINCKDGVDNKPLYYAVNVKKRHAVKELFKLGADIKASGLLQCSVKNNFYDITNILLNLGADIDGRDFLGFTPLHHASSYGFIEVTDLLLKRGANVSLVHEGSPSANALQIAVGQNDLSIVKLLVNAGADVFAKDNTGRNLLHIAASAADFEDTAMLVYLLEFLESVIECKDNTGKTPLLAAAAEGNVANVNFLMKSGSDVNAMSNEKLNVFDYVKIKLRSYREDNLKAKYGMLCTDMFNHLILLRSVNMISCEKLLKNKFIRDLNSSKIDSLARNELTKLKITRIGSSNITLYSFLCKNVSRVAVTLNNDDVRYSVISCGDSYKVDFPRYNVLIVNHLKKGLARKAAVDSAIFKWREYFPALPYECICEIFSYFSNTELKDFSEF